MPERVATIRSKTAVRKLWKQERAEHPSEVDVAFLLQDWDDPYNVGGMFRVAEAVGAELMVMTGKTPCPPHPQISVTSLGQHRRVAWRHEASHEEAARRLVEEGWSLVAIEIAENAESYATYSYPPRTCFVLGNEERGVYASVMKQRAGAVYIPMLGKGRSLNVHVAAAIVAFHARCVYRRR